MAYDNTNRGQVWPNDKKTTDTHPDFKGSVMVKCPCCDKTSDFWVSAWKRKADANPKAPSLSFSVSEKQRREPPPDYPKEPEKGGDMDYDSIPFNQINPKLP